MIFVKKKIYYYLNPSKNNVKNVISLTTNALQIIKLILVGKGNVGNSLIKLLIDKKELFKSKYGIELITIAIFEFDGALIKEDGLNLQEIMEKGTEFRNLNYWNNNILAKDKIKELNADVLIETTPTNIKTGEPALTHIIEALNSNKDVVASSKAPFYLKYNELVKIAKENKRLLRFEATVGSAIPCLAAEDFLKANVIESIYAILNGTSNYILSRMTSEGISFDFALKEAQELGYAEADPTLDIEGYDAAGKLVILANKLMGWNKTIKDVEIQGISKIKNQVVELAKNDEVLVKHLAIAEGDKLIVEPRLVKKDSPLAINGTLNVVQIKTKHAGDIILTGRGAGGYEAASAILNDLLYIITWRSTK